MAGGARDFEIHAAHCRPGHSSHRIILGMEVCRR